MDITKEQFSSYFNELLEKFEIKISDEQIEMFFKYGEMLLSYNEKVNLTAIIDPKEIILKHFIDSISIIKYIDFSKVNSIIDVGTGGGFPGIPLKILFPNIKITLLDSLKKRLIFLDNVIDKLNLKNVETIHFRAEDAAHDSLYREKYDLCVSRAVANLSTLSEYCIPFIKKRGFFVSYKSIGLDKEIEDAQAAIKLLGAKSIKNVFFEVEGMNYHRSFAIIEKVCETKKKFPRKAGTPAKNPLK